MNKHITRKHTTISVSPAASIVWKRWCKAKGMSSAELMDALQAEVKRKKQVAFYNSLPMPDPRTKRLSGKKIDRNYKKTG